MAVKEVALHPIDLASADAAGAPLADTDATHVDLTDATIQPVGSANDGGTVFLAAAQNHAHEGVHSVHSDANANIFGDVRLVSGTGITLTQSGQDITVSGSGSSVNKVTLGEHTAMSNVGITEEILYEWNINFDDAGGASIQARLTALTRVTGGTGTYKLYVGATAAGSTAGGTARATITETAVTYTKETNLGAGFANPGGMQLVQLTAANSAGGNKNLMRGLEIAIG